MDHSKFYDIALEAGLEDYREGLRYGFVLTNKTIVIGSGSISDTPTVRKQRKKHLDSLNVDQKIVYNLNTLFNFFKNFNSHDQLSAFFNSFKEDGGNGLNMYILKIHLQDGRMSYIYCIRDIEEADFSTLPFETEFIQLAGIKI